MNKAARNNLIRLIGFSISLSDKVDAVARRSIILADNSYNLRQLDSLSLHAQTLLDLPENYQGIGKYYLGLATQRHGLGRLDLAQNLFEDVVAHAPDVYKARGILALGSVAEYRGDTESELRFYREALRFKQLDYFTLIETNRAISLAVSREGNHAGAAAHLERFLPVAKAAPDARLYCDVLNSYAVELGKVGRKYEARNIIKHVIVSPFAFAYPEWQDTASKLKEANRSLVAVPQIVPKPVKAPQPVIRPKQPASVLSFPKLKVAPLPEKPEKVKPREIGDMTAGEKRDLILAALRTNTVRENEYNKLLFMCGLVESGPAVNEIDLEDEMLLDDLVVEWANLIDPERLAAVMSALRDCEDDVRRNDILDRIIRKAFEESRTCGLTESEWRLKVECKLPEK